jgi:hypothetical protein
MMEAPVKWPKTDEEIAAGAERAMSEGLFQKQRDDYAECLRQARKSRQAEKPLSGVTE